MKKRLLGWWAACLLLSGIAVQTTWGQDATKWPTVPPPSSINTHSAPTALASDTTNTSSQPQSSADQQTSPSSASDSTNVSLSVMPTAQRAPWQQHLTLGAGDILNFAIYVNDAPDEIRENVVIGPDGRISYLQAQDVMAAGLTIDELRDKMDSELGKYYRSPRTLITPVSITSKKYFVLGAVVTKGVFVIDRPLTVIEALARAGGLATGLYDSTEVELADLSHSFLVRDGHQMPIDFEKLFEQGDLSQNIPIAPNDYLYVASSGANEVYVLGQVNYPGTVPFSRESGTISAITKRGGFTAKAFKGRVLVVRGSLTHPETFVINTGDVLSGKAPDFRLKAKDIVFVSQQPWQRAEQLLDDATRAFIEAAILTYTGNHVGPFFSPIVN